MKQLFNYKAISTAMGTYGNENSIFGSGDLETIWNDIKKDRNYKFVGKLNILLINVENSTNN